MQKLAVLVVDDDALYRRYIKRAVEETGWAESVLAASSTEIAIERLRLAHYDIVLTDLSMSGADGIALLEHVRANYPHISVVLISSFGGIGQQVTLRALQLGALDYIVKNDAADKVWFVGRLREMFRGIIPKKADAKSIPDALIQVSAPVGRDKPAPHASAVEYLVIIASTGGPKAIETVLGGLAKDVGCPVIVVQHIPARFTEVMATQLALKYHIDIQEARDGEMPLGGRIYLAPGGMHLLLNDSGAGCKFAVIEKLSHSVEASPSADRLFKSMARALESNRIVVAVLTGMGNDGQKGLTALSANNHVTILAQDEPTCVVYGMSRAIVEAGLADEVLPLQRIAARINEICGGR